MNRDGFRFRPPGCELEPELIWALVRAFGPPPGPPIEVGRAERARHWARTLGLGERIASRLPRPDAGRQLPAEIVDELRRAREQLVARTLLLRELLGRVAELALEVGTRVVALKGIALLESGACECGSRPLLDLDLLVAQDHARPLARALEAAGLERSGESERHHLPPLADRRLGTVEIHLRIPGLSLGGGGAASAADLVRSDLVCPSERIEGLDLPRPTLLAVHALAHGLDQHGLSPTAYPVTRLVADLIDLDTALPPDADRWLRASVSARERLAAESLRRALAAGVPLEAGADGLALLRHTIVAFTSPSYRAGLRRRAALRALRRGQWSKFRAGLGRRAGRRRRLQ